MVLPVWDPPAEATFAEPFWAAAREGRCVLPRCSVCGDWQWYPDSAGPGCPGATYEWEELAGTGTVYTFTVVRRSFLPDQRDRAPYTVVLVELDGAAGVRLVGNLADGAEPRIGLRVRAGTDRDAATGHVQPVFRPIEV